mmetsp:Transcript_38496/g.86429  ORF Transcript_38496/g.86429 Transcript_38496/m.86429 type:complete len:409 (-) Transcript_38496:104-1330(-)
MDVTKTRHDRVMLAAALIIDLYMRQRIAVNHWVLGEGDTAAAYAVEVLSVRSMHHFLDKYCERVEEIFKDMRLPRGMSDAAIWKSLEQRGILKHRADAVERTCVCLKTTTAIYDLEDPQVLEEIKACYFNGALLLYDRDYDDRDGMTAYRLMFVTIMQELFRHAFESRDAFATVMRHRCPPFEAGEIQAPPALAHAGMVIRGIVDRAQRFGSQSNTVHLSAEAALYQEQVTDRLHDVFFASPAILQRFTSSKKGEMTRHEFVRNLQRSDAARELRYEGFPVEVVRSVVQELAERVFFEVDVNRDGTLSQDELHSAFQKKHAEATARQAALSKVSVAKEFVKSRYIDMSMSVRERHKELEQEARQYERRLREENYTKLDQRRRIWITSLEDLKLHDYEVDNDQPEEFNY